MNHLPAVSVCIASYNHARFLPHCLDSILAQTFQDLEIVVVDDGSKDESHAILVEYQQRYPQKIHYSFHPEHANRGISATTNQAIRASTGRYVAFIGSDDIWYADKLEKQVALLDEHPEYAYAYSYAHFMDEIGADLPGLYGVDIMADRNPTGRMILSCHQPAMTVIVRRDCLDQLSWFDETLVYGDWDLMIRLTARWKFGFIAQPLARYRIHGKNVSKRIDPKVDLDRILAFTQAIERKSLQVGGGLAIPRNQALLALQQCFLFYCKGEEAQASGLLNRALEIDASILSDVDFLDEWLGQWKPDFYTPERANFGFWFIDHLPVQPPGLRAEVFDRLMIQSETAQFFVRRGLNLGRSGGEVESIFQDVPRSLQLPAEWKAQVLNQVYPALLFESHDLRQGSRTRKFWSAAVKNDPSWLKNRGVLSIGLKSLLPTGISRAVGSFVRRLRIHLRRSP